jgi:hypothetical protein
MTAVDSTNDAAAALPESITNLAVPSIDASGNELTPEEQAELERAIQRIEHFPRELGWLMVYVGVLGVVLPGIIGFPFVIAGGAVLMPSGRKWLARYVGRKPGRLMRASLKQITRMADDIERRYPTLPEASH